MKSLLQPLTTVFRKVFPYSKPKDGPRPTEAIRKDVGPGH